MKIKLITSSCGHVVCLMVQSLVGRSSGRGRGRESAALSGAERTLSPVKLGVDT